MRSHEGHRRLSGIRLVGIRLVRGRIGVRQVMNWPVGNEHATVQPAVEAIRRAEKVVDERIRRMPIDLVGRADLFDPPVVHHHDAIGDLERFFLVVRDEHRRHVQFVVQAPQPAAQLLAHLGVECAERFVEQQHPRFDRECARQRDALALPARQLVGLAIGEPVELHELEQLVHAPADLALATAARARGRTRSPKATFSNTVMCRNSA